MYTHMHKPVAAHHSQMASAVSGTSCVWCVVCGVFALMADNYNMPKTLHLVFDSGFIAGELLNISNIGDELRKVSKPMKGTLSLYSRQYFDYLREVQGWHSLRWQPRPLRL